MFPVIWIIAILFWMFLAANAFLTILVINVLLWLALIFFGILLIIRGFRADEKRIEWMEDIPWIDDYDDSDD